MKFIFGLILGTIFLSCSAGNPFTAIDVLERDHIGTVRKLDVSFSPSPLPTVTLAPTSFCASGTYFDDSDNSCILCPIGRYSSFDGPYYPRSCDLCPAGEFNSQLGSTNCSSCGNGLFSAPDRSECKTCEAGEYLLHSNECVECESGRYAPQALYDSCLTCRAGSYSTTNTTKAISCATCRAGTYSNAGAVICIECSRGKYSLKGASECMSCSAGFYSPSVGSTGCLSCSTGRYTPVTTSNNLSTTTTAFWNCSSCPVGKYQHARGQAECLECEAGRYVDYEGAVGCLRCDSFTTSASGASRCNLATTDYYMSFSTNSKAYSLPSVKSCPNHATCDFGKRYVPVPNEGYWSDHSDVKYAAIMYKCNNFNCKEKKSSDSNSSCWLISNYNDSDCSSSARSSQLQCRKGSVGPLCGSCENHFFFDASSNTCRNCFAGQKAFAFYGSFLVGVLLLLLCLVYAYRKHALYKDYFCLQVMLNFDAAVLKTLFSTIQIVVASCLAMNVKFPDPFHSFINFMSIFSLKFTSTFECWFDSRLKSFQFFVWFWCFLPLCLNLIILLGSFVKIYRRYLKHQQEASAELTSEKNSDNSNEDDDRTEAVKEYTEETSDSLNRLESVEEEVRLQGRGIKNMTTHDQSFPHQLKMLIKKFRVRDVVTDMFWYHFLTFFLFIPLVLSKILRVLDCTILESGERFASMDTSISCSSQDYQSMKVIAICFLALYGASPLLWFGLLFQKRYVFHSNNSTIKGKERDENHVMYLCDNNPDIAIYKFLFNDYTSSNWWFEIVDVYRRTLFIGVLPLLSTSSKSATSFFGCLLSLFSIYVMREKQPFRQEFANTLAYVSQFIIFVTYYVSLSLATTTNSGSSGASNSFKTYLFTGDRLGSWLLVVNIIPLSMAAWWAYSSAKRQHLYHLKRLLKAEHYEDAREFGEKKLKIAFDNLQLYSIPQTHVLVFYYASFEQAEVFKKLGIPALDRFKGVPFSMRPPHKVSVSEVDVFGKKRDKNQVLTLKCLNEEVIALSIEKKFLEPLTGYEQDHGLCMISVQTLNAMRPQSFSSIIEGDHSWVDDKVLFPPQCIINSFLILDVEKPYEEMDIVKYERGISANTKRIKQIKSIDSVHVLSDYLTDVRVLASKQELLPLFHYTSLHAATIILKRGLRMNAVQDNLHHDIANVFSGGVNGRVGQTNGGGGVYFTTKSPASYSVGSREYEINLIKDLYSVDNVTKYKGHGKVSVVIVYGCDPKVLDKASGGKDSSRVISQSTFQQFSYEDKHRNYFLGTDRILGAFLVRNKKVRKSMRIAGEKRSNLLLEAQISHDVQSLETLNKVEEELKENHHRVKKFETALARGLRTDPPRKKKRSNSLTKKKKQELSMNEKVEQNEKSPIPPANSAGSIDNASTPIKRGLNTLSNMFSRITDRSLSTPQQQQQGFGGQKDGGGAAESSTGNNFLTPLEPPRDQNSLTYSEYMAAREKRGDILVNNNKIGFGDATNKRAYDNYKMNQDSIKRRDFDQSSPYESSKSDKAVLDNSEKNNTTKMMLDDSSHSFFDARLSPTKFDSPPTNMTSPPMSKLKQRLDVKLGMAI